MASKRAIRRKACGKKTRYATQEAAQAGIRALTRAIGWPGYMVPYRCAFCGQFHFGHPPAGIRRAIEAKRG